MKSLTPGIEINISLYVLCIYLLKLYRILIMFQYKIDQNKRVVFWHLKHRFLSFPFILHVLRHLNIELRPFHTVSDHIREYIVRFFSCKRIKIVSCHYEYHSSSKGKGSGWEKEIIITVSWLGPTLAHTPADTMKGKKEKITKAKIYKFVNTDFLYFARFMAGWAKLRHCSLAWARCWWPWIIRSTLK